MATRPEVVLVRHGETEWSRAGKHTSSTDLPLTQAGERQARELRSALAGRAFVLVLSSPLIRARRTAELSGFDDPELDSDLRELNYGDYEGRTTADVQREVPGWTVWSGALPGGETLAAAAVRADRVVGRIRAATGDVLVFGHGHLSRILGARWCGQPAAEGAHLLLDAASISVLGYERSTPAIRLWNRTLDQFAGQR